MAVFFTSDLHLGDKRLDMFGRDILFKDSNEVDQAIIKNWNSIVGEKDHVFVLGDVAFSKSALDLIKRLNGYKILIKGNYDDPKQTAKFDVTDDLLSEYFIKVKEEAFYKIGDEKVYLNHFPVNGKEDYFSIVGHIHGLWKVQRNMLNVGIDAWNYFPISEDKVKFMMNAIRKYYDQNVYAGELECNLKYKNKE